MEPCPVCRRTPTREPIGMSITRFGEGTKQCFVERRCNCEQRFGKPDDDLLPSR